MYSIVERKKKIKKLIESEEIKEWCRLDGENTFVRNRKISCKDLLYLSLNNKAKTISIEIREYEKNLKGNDKVDYTDEAYLKKRRHLNPMVFKKLNFAFLNSFYNDTPNEVKLVKGYILFGIDGSKYEIPNTPQNRKVYGSSKNHSKNELPARANTSGIYDLKNKFFCDVDIDVYNSNEKDLAKRNIEQMQEIIPTYKKIVTMDRNYASLEFINWLNERNIFYVFRLNKTAYKKEIESMDSNDEIVSIKHTVYRICRIRENYPKSAEKLRKLEETKVRIIKGKLPNNEEIRIISNLPFEEFNTEEILQIYQERWGIETSYDTMKNKLKSESFTGKLPIIVEQDFYAQAFIHNQVQDIINEANEKLKEKEKKLKKQKKLEYQVNINKAIGLFKDEFIKIMLIDNSKIASNKYDELVEEMTNYVTAIKRNRPTQPRKFNCNNRYRTNFKPSY